MSVKLCEGVADFDAALNDAGGKLVVVDFYADWCGPCKQIAPKIVQMAGNMSDVIFLKVNVDDNEELAAKYEVSAMPTFIFLKNGEKVATVVGASENKITEEIKKNK